MSEKNVQEETYSFRAQLSKAQAEFTPIVANKTVNVRTKTGGAYSYKYADLASLIKATRPALTKQGLSVMQTFENSNPGSISVTTSIFGSRTEAIEVCSLALPVPQGCSVQDLGAIITYGRRYTYAAILTLAPEDEDSDGPPPEEKHGRQDVIPYDGPFYRSPPRASAAAWAISLDELKDLQVAAKAAGLVDDKTKNQDRFIEFILMTFPGLKLADGEAKKGRRLAWDRMSWKEYDYLYRSLEERAHKGDEVEPEPEALPEPQPEPDIF